MARPLPRCVQLGQSGGVSESGHNPYVRLDRALVARGLSRTRARARDAILRGTVRVDGDTNRKPGTMIGERVSLTIDDPASDYVARSALKLAHGLDAFGIIVDGEHALDIGASTGGFTQVLLERGAAHVTAVDVGRGQLHPMLAADPRVTSIEGLNARDLNASHLASSPGIVVTDVSFISLRLALPQALALARDGAVAVLLVKPQFELGRGALDKRGIVRDPAEAERAATGLRDFLAGEPGWRALGLEPSPIMGGDGNAEWLLCGRKESGIG